MVTTDYPALVFLILMPVCILKARDRPRKRSRLIELMAVNGVVYHESKMH